MSKASRVKKLLACALFVVAALCAAAGRVGAQEWKAHDVPLFVSASHPLGHQGFVRVINRSDVSGEVVIDAFDDEGVPYGVPYRLVTLRIGAGETVHFNSRDLEKGNTDKGLSPGIGAGSGDWRLRLRSPLALEVLSYNRTRDGLLAPLHDQVPSAVVRRPSTGEEATGQRVVIFNPASNVNQVSRLRIINPGGEAAAVTIEGTDDAGASPGMGVELTVPAGASRTLESQELESGEWDAGSGVSGELGDGKGKWRLAVTSEQVIQVMSLLASSTGHLVNLSTAAPGSVSYANACAVAGYAEEVSFPDAVLRAEIGTAMIPVRGRAASDPIAPPDLALLRSFSAHQQGIRTLTGLECATGLESLSLGRNRITDVSLSGLLNLESLGLGDNRITHVPPLSSLPPDLRTLNLKRNRITDVPPLSSLPPNLGTLSLAWNQITDISPFVSSAGQSGIRYIDLTGNPLSVTACRVDIPALQRRGIKVQTDCY